MPGTLTPLATTDDADRSGPPILGVPVLDETTGPATVGDTDSGRDATAAHLFRCTFCGSVIPWPLSPVDLGLDPDESPTVYELYSYDRCFCGFGRFVRCESVENPAPGQHDETAGAVDRPVPATAHKVSAARYEVVPVAQVHPNPRQPRKFFDGEALRGLAESIRTVGLLEDILVRPHVGGYEIVLGERRWKAAQLAGLATISAKVVDLDDDEARSISITENIHRENLTDIEEAFSFKAYIDVGGEISSVGRNFGGMEKRVAERLRLLNSHHFIDYQRQRIEELTETINQLRAQRQRLGPARYEARIVDADGLVPALQDGFEVAAKLPDGRLAVRRALG